MDNYIDDSSIHEGHRSRMRAKLLLHGQRIFDTYELLEMLLYAVIPYKDTNPISKRLLARFGDLDGVLRAPAEELMQVSGVGERASAFIASVNRLSDLIGAEILPNSRSLESYEEVGNNFVNYFSNSNDRRVVAFFLDSSMRVISFKTMFDLDYDSGGVKARAFVDEAMRTRASVVISAHNHPYGPFYPTPGDRETHSLITGALSMAGVVHAEHFIVSGNRYAGMGSLSNFKTQVEQSPELATFIERRDRVDGAILRVSATSSLDNGWQMDMSGETYCKESLLTITELLGYCLGRGAEDIAKELLLRYRTVENVFTASSGEIKNEYGERCAFFLKLFAYITSRRATDRFVLGRYYTKSELAEHLKAMYLGESVEKTYLICFNANGSVIDIQMLGEGTVNASEILPRKAVEIAVHSSAHSVSLSHNHPFGSTRASADDLAVTKHFMTLFTTCDIRFLDHYIVAGQLCDAIDFEK